MKTRMMIGIAVAALLLATESVQAQPREVRRERTERMDRRNDRHIDQPDPRRSRPSQPLAPQPRRIKVVDNEVIRSFARERYDSNRLKMADMIFNTDGYMTSDQIREVSAIFDYDSNRIKFLKKAYLNCVDCHNFYRVLSTLEYSSSREKIIKFVLDNPIEDFRNGEPIRKVSNSDMTAILKLLKNESFDSTRGKLANMIVAGNLFTSRQIADMAKLFTFDSNRYDFLVIAYNSCVDPQNYVVAANTLEFSTNRSDLMRKVARRP
ncbi:MAG: DUF4476 domain-containing protein [Bacteroidaceae bacterium]|nr:DUF4476 domain-containing protein [Bacteroidaceae bacterium]